MSKNHKITLHLNDSQNALALECQKQYEEIFQEYISLEEVFIHSLFFTSNINNIKLAILESYKDNIISGDKAINTGNKAIVKPSSNVGRKKRKIPLKTVHSNQAKLGGFP